jgi:hypothetical protein
MRGGGDHELPSNDREFGAFFFVPEHGFYSTYPGTLVSTRTPSARVLLLLVPTQVVWHLSEGSRSPAGYSRNISWTLDPEVLGTRVPWTRIPGNPSFLEITFPGTRVPWNSGSSSLELGFSGPEFQGTRVLWNSGSLDPNSRENEFSGTRVLWTRIPESWNSGSLVQLAWWFVCNDTDAGNN